MGRKAATAAFLVILVLASVPAATAARGKERRDWVRIDYADLVDPSTVTHGGETVGALLRKAGRKASALPEPVRSDLSPCLEPFSSVCNDILAAGAPGEEPYVRIDDAYPEGSPQPAWAALFREGHYQLFVGKRGARLFLKGDNPAALLRRRHGVVRHPLLEVLKKSGADRFPLEVYAFRNDYASRTLLLDPTPYVTAVTAASCAPRTRDLPLGGLSDFFARGIVLEAAEIDDNGDFHLYGGPAAESGVRPASLSDFAVVYRAVFHHGGNPPYVSLDKSEDNRYAKVNFGGFLRDTRVGNVLLESDRLFKTMIAGLDPDTRLPATDRIRAVVPDFRTVDERVLFRDRTDIVLSRFWFYPDGIRTVTDGRIGVVESFRFLADVERVGGNAGTFPEGREAVDHLNRNFERYGKVFPPYRELDTVGRLMAVAKWLRGVDTRRRVDLDALLSVELPAQRTSRRELKILAASDGIRVSHGTAFEEFRKVYCLDGILQEGDAATGEPAFLERAGKYVERFPAESVFPDGRRRCPPATRRHITTSLSGGVNLNPADIAPSRRSPDSPLIARIRAVRSSPGTGGGIVRSTLRGAAPPREKTGRPAPAQPATPAPAKAKTWGPGRPATGIVVRTPAYAGEIVVTGSLRPGGTVVLKRGGPNVPGSGRGLSPGPQ